MCAEEEREREGAAAAVVVVIFRREREGLSAFEGGRRIAKMEEDVDEEKIKELG